ncbi:recombinase family protein [Thalassotalea sp. HSM 43]|uniref:recombinase family protein n=1 Tax=Thalassotalea sp. HSM 43 TaxID=2552945 RepID=UPI0010806503|nr:recombinase family protein [Thalassotalea sp. HSM 43]QBY04697.1 recombinase family protein [Thalassotalea sp. HSM 43]
MTTLIGYARTSTVKQDNGLAAQLEQLSAYGCNNILQEQVSSVNDEREQLGVAIGSLNRGDKLVVTKLDRLARSIMDLHNILAELKVIGADLVILDLNIDTSTSTGRLMLNLLGSVAEFEREVMLERQKEGIQRAKEQGKYKGRKPTDETVKAKVAEHLGKGLKQADICKLVGIGKTTFYKVKAELNL